MQQRTAEKQFVSVAICTRNRQGSVHRAVKAVLASGHTDFELMVLDQSDNDGTQDILADICVRDRRVCYIRLERPGKPGALNRALHEAHGSILALTDDDCEPAPDWLAKLLPTFADPRIGAVFGNVDSPPHDANKAYVPVVSIANAATVTNLREFLLMPGLRNFGMGANMAVRVSAVKAIGGWDSCVGPGAKFGCADDHDLAVRLLLAGWKIAFRPDMRVRHYGFRAWKEARQDVQKTGFGFGATFAKYLRCRKIYYGSLRMLRHFTGQIIGRVVRGQRPLGVAFPLGWIRGVFAALCHPLDPATYMFLPVHEQTHDVEMAGNKP